VPCKGLRQQGLGNRSHPGLRCCIATLPVGCLLRVSKCIYSRYRIIASSPKPAPTDCLAAWCTANCTPFNSGLRIRIYLLYYFIPLHIAGYLLTYVPRMNDPRCQLRDDPGGSPGSVFRNGATNVGRRRTLLAFKLSTYPLPSSTRVPLAEMFSPHLFKLN